MNVSKKNATTRDYNVQDDMSTCAVRESTSVKMRHLDITVRQENL